jgi:hypothetical protein
MYLSCPTHSGGDSRLSPPEFAIVHHLPGKMISELIQDLISFEMCHSLFQARGLIAQQ